MLLPYLIIILLLIAVYLFLRLISLKREIKEMAKQLQNYNKQRTNKKLDMALLEQNMEYLGMEINNLIDLYNKEKRVRIRSENELKKTIANMSHDLRTPLTSIIGYLQILESKDATDEERKEFVAIAKNRAKRLESLLNDFFDLSLIESSEFELKQERFNMKNVVMDVLMSFYDRFNEKGMEPIIHMPDEEIFITADRSAVTRVIENLLSNAIKYSSGRSIIVNLKEEEQSVKMIVQNETRTLTEREVELLFDRFYMADKSRSGKSAGLGLSIVKSFMKRMDGDVSAKLNDGKLLITCEWKSCNNSQSFIDVNG